MKQKKRWRVIILVLFLCFLFSACQYIILYLSGNDDNKTKTVPLPHSSFKIKSKYVWNYIFIFYTEIVQRKLICSIYEIPN